MWSDGAVDAGDHCRGKDGFKVPAKRELVAAPTPGGLARALAESQACRHACTHTPPMSSETFTTGALSYVVEVQGVNIRAPTHVCYFSVSPDLTVFSQNSK